MLKFPRLVEELQDMFVVVVSISESHDRIEAKCLGSSVKTLFVLDREK